VSLSDRIPIERRTIPNGHRATDAGAVRRGARLAGRGWLGQGFPQGPDLPVGVASVAAQGADVGQPALLGPAADRLWGHLEELGDLRGAQVPGLGCLGQRALPFLVSSPIRGRHYARRGRMPSSVLHRLAILECIPVQLGFPAGACMDVDQSVVAGPGALFATYRSGSRSSNWNAQPSSCCSARPDARL
jgi:hypothetical protein